MSAIDPRVSAEINSIKQTLEGYNVSTKRIKALESIIENTTISNQRLIVDAIIKSLEKKPGYLKELETNSNLANILNINIDFIKYIININIDNIKYIDWHNLHDTRKDTILEYIITKINKEHIDFDVMKYPFHALFFQNTSFMEN